MTPTPEHEEAARKIVAHIQEVGSLYGVCAILAARDAENDRVIAELRAHIASHDEQEEQACGYKKLIDAQAALAAVNRKRELDRRDLQSLRAKLAALRQPVGSEEEREALIKARHMENDPASFDSENEKTIVVLARALRAKTAALKEAGKQLELVQDSARRGWEKLKEAEQKIAALEKKP